MWPFTKRDKAIAELTAELALCEAIYSASNTAIYARLDALELRFNALELRNKQYATAEHTPSAIPLEIADAMRARPSAAAIYRRRAAEVETEKIVKPKKKHAKT